jgi:hypothetical protein
MAPSGAYLRTAMEFNYELKINNAEASLKMFAPSMSSILDQFSLNGPTRDVEYLKKKVNWKSSVSEIVDRLNEMHFCQILSSSEKEDQPKQGFTASYGASWGSNSSKKKKKDEDPVVEETEESED